MKKNRQQLIDLGFKIDFTNPKNYKYYPREYAIKEDVYYLQCNLCGDDVFKHINSFGKSMQKFMHKESSCRVCLNSQKQGWKHKSESGLTKKQKEFSFIDNNQPNFFIKKENNKFSIWYYLGNTYEYKKANCKEFINRLEAVNRITNIDNPIIT
jgi:hypothetical protein